MSQKSLFENIKGLFANISGKTEKNKNISKVEAIDLQKQYISDNCIAGANSYPPYIEILKQLDSPKIEVFQAALYYLTNIASNENKYKNDITEKIAAKSQQKNISEERKKALLQANTLIRG